MIKFTLSYRHNYLDIIMHIPHILLKQEQTLSMPRYIPGSYTLREFANNMVGGIYYKSANLKIADKLLLNKISHSQWVLPPSENDLELFYTLYANDNSVRGNFSNEQQVLINGAATFVYIKEIIQSKHNISYEITINLQSNWHLHSTLPIKNNTNNIILHALNYDILIDTPILICSKDNYLHHKIDAKHNILFVGKIQHLQNKRNNDVKNITQDIQKICSIQNAFFNCNDQPKNYYLKNYTTHSDYLFLVNSGENLYGGLEHYSCTMLQIPPESLVYDKNIKTTQRKKYINFLGLCSHEYFHNWWVKRIKPQSFIDANLQQEFDTSLLWMFEGFTAYYDNLFLCRSGCISVEEYVKLLQENINSVYQYNGHKHHTLHEAGLDAWIKYYKPNQNSINTSISYYTKGALAALFIDLYIRKQSSYLYSLDDIIKYIWQHYGINPFCIQKETKGINYQIFLSISQKLANIDLSEVLNKWIYSTYNEEEMLLLEYLQHFGIKSTVKAYQEIKWGIQVQENNETNFGVKVKKIYTNGLAYTENLEINDILVSVNGVILDKDNLDTILKSLYMENKEQKITLHYIRNRQLQAKMIELKTFENRLFNLKTNKNSYTNLNGWLC